MIENILGIYTTTIFFFFIIIFLNEKLAIPDQHKNDRLKKESIMNANFT